MSVDGGAEGQGACERVDIGSRHAHQIPSPFFSLAFCQLFDSHYNLQGIPPWSSCFGAIGKV